MGKSKNIIVGIVGCGGVAENHARAYSECSSSSLAWVYDRDPRRAAEFAAKTGAKVAKSIGELGNEVDAVSICTPPSSHLEVAKNFLKAGVAVLCEKPLESTVQKSRSLAAMAKRSGTPFMVGFTHRFHPPVVQGLRVLRSGRLGAPRFFRNVFGGKVSFAGGFRVDPRISGGGCLSDTASHSVDLFRLFMGEAVAVSAVTTSVDKKLPVEDLGCILLEGREGLMGTVMATTALPAISNVLEVICDKGTLLISYYVPGQPDLSIQTAGHKAPLAVAVPKSMPYKFVGQARYFIDCVRSGTQPVPGAADGLASAVIIDAAYESAAKKRTVRLKAAR